MNAKEYLSKDRFAAEVIVALADNSMNVTDAADAIYVHRCTVHYRVKKIREGTGLNPFNFYDLCKLLTVAKEILKEG